MDSGNKHERALQAFRALCANLDAHNWHYKKFEEDLTIDTGVNGEDLPISLLIQVDEDRELVILLSLQPFSVPENKRLDMAAAVSVVNNRLVDGSFDFDIKKGRLVFRMTSCYIDSILGDDLFTYMIGVSCKTVDDFNDKFMMLSSGMISIEKFIELINQ